MRKAGSLMLAAVLLAGCSVGSPLTPGQMVESLAGGQPDAPPAGRTGPPASSPAAAPAVTAPAGAGVTWEETRRQVYPMIMSVDDTPEQGRPPLLARTLLNQAVVTFVVDRPSHWIFTTSRHLEQWGVDADGLIQTALENLASQAVQPEVIRDEISGRELWRFARHDGFDAARILNIPLWRQRAAGLEGSLVVAIPARDLLYAFSDTDPALVASMRERVVQDYERMPYPITTQLFSISAGGELTLYAAGG